MQKRPSLWPTEGQELLLKAALGEGQPAIDAWTAWRGQFDYDGLDTGSRRLVPLLHANLVKLGVADPLMAKMAEFEYLIWGRHQQMIQRLKVVIGSLSGAGVDVLLLKGLPLGLAYYDSLALRPIGDLDIMIRHGDWRLATDAVAAVGWRPEDATMGDPFQRSTHAVAFTDKRGFELDIHVSPFHECLEPGKLATFWQNAVPVESHGVSARILCAPDQLLHCLTHGLRANEISSVRWVCDAVTILRKKPELDWQRLLDQTQRLRFGRPVSVGLAYISTVFPELIPAAPLEALDRYQISAVERVEWFARSRAQLSGQGARIGNFFRLYEKETLGTKLKKIPSYLANTFGTRSGTQTVIAFGRRGLKVLRSLLQ